jgi:hypothetical protein
MKKLSWARHADPLGHDVAHVAYFAPPGHAGLLGTRIARIERSETIRRREPRWTVFDADGRFVDVFSKLRVAKSYVARTLVPAVRA